MIEQWINIDTLFRHNQKTITLSARRIDQKWRCGTQYLFVNDSELLTVEATGSRHRYPKGKCVQLNEHATVIDNFENAERFYNNIVLHGIK